MKRLLWVVMLLLCVSVALAASPVMNSSRISPTTAYTANNLAGYCNASDADNNSLSYYYKWWNGSVVYESNNLIYDSIAYTNSQIIDLNETSIGEPYNNNWVGQLNNGNIFTAFYQNSNGEITVCNSTGGSCTNSIFINGAVDYVNVENDNNTPIIAYQHIGDTYKGKLTFCNSTGGNCTTKIFNDGETRDIALKVTDSNIIIAYKDKSNLYKGTFAICNSTGDSCTEKVFNDSLYASGSSNLDFDIIANNSLVTSYTNSLSKAQVTVCNSTGESCISKSINDTISIVEDIEFVELSNLNKLFLISTNLDTYKVVCDNNFENCESTYFGDREQYNEIIRLSDGRVALFYLKEDSGEFDGVLSISDKNGNNWLNNTITTNTSLMEAQKQLSDGRLALVYRDNSDSQSLKLAITNDLINNLSHSTEYLVNTLSSTYTNKNENWTFSCLANDGTTNSSWLNSTTLTISNTLPSFTQINFSRSLSHSVNIASQINATDADLDTSTFTINSTDFDINSSGYLNKTNSLATVGTYNLSINVSDGTDIKTGWIYYTITNTAPVVNTVTISPSPASDTSNLSITNTTSDVDSDSILAYSLKWYKNGVLQSGLNNESIINNGNLTTGDNWTASLAAYDGLWSDFTNSTTSTIGDTTEPILSNDALSASSGVNDAAFSIYVNVTETNTISSVSVEITDPNTISTNYSMTLSSGVSNNGKYIKTYTPSTDGIYTFKFYAVDGSSNERELISALTYTESTSAGDGGGGGGGSVDLNKRVCNISVVPQQLSFSFATIKELTIKNTDSVSYNPSFAIVGDFKSLLKITNPTETVLPNTDGSFGVQYTGINQTGTSKIILSSSNCKDIEISIFLSEEQTFISIINELFNGNLSKVLSQPLSSTFKAFTVFWLFLVITLLVGIVFYNQVSLNIKKSKYVTSLIWTIFGLFVSSIFTILISASLI